MSLVHMLLVALFVGPGFLKAHHRRWFKRDIFSSEGRVDQNAALQDFNDAIRVDPGFAPAYLSRGNWHRIKGHLENALDDCNEAIRLDPHNATAYRSRAGAFRAMNDLERADQDQRAAERIERKSRK